MPWKTATTKRCMNIGGEFQNIALFSIYEQEKYPDSGYCTSQVCITHDCPSRVNITAKNMLKLQCHWALFKHRSKWFYCWYFLLGFKKSFSTLQMLISVMTPQCFSPCYLVQRQNMDDTSHLEKLKSWLSNYSFQNKLHGSRNNNRNRSVWLRRADITPNDSLPCADCPLSHPVKGVESNFQST